MEWVGWLHIFSGFHRAQGLQLVGIQEDLTLGVFRGQKLEEATETPSAALQNAETSCQLGFKDI
jgi:hypothetical protein